jgi:nicotinamide phosphoribosyltransferase
MPHPFRPNPLRKSDSYKDTHIYDDDVTELLSYFEARGGEYPYTNFFGLQGLLMEEFEGEFFTLKDLQEEYENSQEHFYPEFPYHFDDWKYILDTYQGRLPVEIKAVKEGSCIPVGNVLYTVRSTDKRVPGIGQWMETVLQHTWYTTAVATKSRMWKEICAQFLDETADDRSALRFQGHDFGFRGATGTQAAGRGGAAHLLNFFGTDTKIAMDYLHQYYGAPRVSGYSVPATEHSMMTLKGEGGEAGVVGAMLRKYPKGIVSIVGDSYDIFHFAKDILCGQYKEQIRNREGKVVCRPDSGDMNTQVPQLLDIFSEGFGFRENSKSYKVLAPCIGVIWGDGLDLYSIQGLFRAIKAAHYSTENIVQGMGGGLLQKVNRDTQRCKLALCNAVIDGVDFPAFKNPSTDHSKASKGGRLALVYDKTNDRYATVQDHYGNGVSGDLLETVFYNGEMKRIQTLDEIKKLCEIKAAAHATA